MSIVVFGSTNSDLVVSVPHLPTPGETVIGGDFHIHRGGKGANQAVAAARVGADVTFVSNIGLDDLGDAAVNNFIAEGINIDHIVRDEGRSGVALIMVANSGQNCIAVAPESNALLSSAHIAECEELIAEADIVLAQLEIPLDTVNTIGKLAHKHHTPFILNPAPAQRLSDELLQYVTIITPNESEASLLTGIPVHDVETAKEAALYLRRLGIEHVVITLGELGAVLATADETWHYPAHEVNVVDTTGAGDVFNAALARALITKKDIHHAVIYANAAGALTVTRAGAQNAPSKHRINEFLRQRQA